jgi:membrane protease YdiL (CAAX protease family)
MAYAACCGVGGVYVGSLYLASGGTESRDSPAVVWRRIGVAFVACSVVWLPVARAFPSEGPALIAARLGLRARGAGVGLCWALVLLLLLYAGPLLYSTAPSVRGPTRAQRLRNLVFAPLAEEFVFRGVLSAILVADGKASASRAGLVCLCPLFFGVAHVHQCVPALAGAFHLSPSDVLAACGSCATCVADPSGMDSKQCHFRWPTPQRLEPLQLLCCSRLARWQRRLLPTCSATPRGCHPCEPFGNTASVLASSF